MPQSLQATLYLLTYEEAEADALIRDLTDDRKILKYADRFAEMKIKPAS
jgi:hypothetical protein